MHDLRHGAPLRSARILACPSCLHLLLQLSSGMAQTTGTSTAGRPIEDVVLEGAGAYQQYFASNARRIL